MWGSKLCLLLLLGTHSLAREYLTLAKRYRNFRRFVYDYEAESVNTVNGATDSKSGPTVSCKVEIEVPQTCSFIIRTTECSLSEIFDVDSEGNPVYRPAAGAQAFKAAMEKNSLKISVEGQSDVKLYPEEDEPVNILNIKRGIISALIVPSLDEDRNKEMPSVHGVCPTAITVNSREDIATDVTINRDLSGCDWFIARRQATSPLALISGMNYPLSKMIGSTQTCNYQFDNQKKHMTSGTCREKHIFLPFSHKNEYGITAMVKQTLTLRETNKINDRIFERNEDNLKYLPMDVADEKSPVQTKDTAIATIQTLSTLSQSSQGQDRTELFHKLVSELRGLETEILGSVAEEMMDISTSLTFQALVQCGTPECTSAMLKILRTFDTAALEVDAVVYALALLPNPSPLMVKDMLSMAQYKQSKPIMYALSNVARRLYKAEGVTSEITAVSEFMASLLGADCAGEKELTFLVLRVIGNMGDAMEAADPTIKSTLLKCMRQPATTLSVQLAAIQALRRMSVRSNLQRVSQYPKGAVQKRLAAYLMLMRNPQDSDIEMVKKLLTQEPNIQIKSFVTSHIYNILSSKAPETQIEKILDAVQDTDIIAHSEYTTKSRNYKLGMEHDSMQANILGNIIFDQNSNLPREVLLETTLKAFGFNMDIWEFGMEGKGFEPTIEALFGKNGFFPDTVSKALYWAEDKMPLKLKEVLDKWVSPLKSEERKVSNSVSLFSELGYIKTNDEKILNINVSLFLQAIANLVSKTDNEFFAHYIFMDNKFTLPTASGMPLKFALSGTFTPGAKGGLIISPKMNELVFMPSVGVEFRTHMGIYIPEFVSTGVEMQTKLYHESALKAKITMEQNQVKLSIPTPQEKTQLLRISNKVLIVGSGYTTEIPHKMGAASCGHLFKGFRYCSKTLGPNISSKSNAPYFPLNGETSYSFDIRPSGKVSVYTAIIAYELLSEGKDDSQKVDSLKMILRTEGDEPIEATAMMKYNRNRNVFTTSIQVPDFDIETGIKIGISDSSSEGKSIILELSNKNVPQLSLIGRAKLQAMTDGMLQVQLLVPSLRTDATVTATMSKADGLIMEIKSDVKLPEISSIQAVTFKYGMFAVNIIFGQKESMIKVPLQYGEDLLNWFQGFVDDVMNQQIPNTDMRLSHILEKGVQVKILFFSFFITVFNLIFLTDVWVCFCNLTSDSTFKYKFNEDRMAISIPLPLGGKSSEDLRIPPVITSPHIDMPQLKMEISPREIHIPKFTIPSECDLTLPLMGMMEMSAKINSNFYNWEAIASAGNKTVDAPSYVAKFSVMADSPFEVLSFSAEGSTSITDTEHKTMEFTLDGSLKHSIINTGFNVLETIAVTDNVLSTGRYNVYAAFPKGLDTSMTITTQFTIDSSMLFGDLNTDANLTVGPMTASTTYLHTFSVEPMKKEAKMESILRVNSELLKVANKLKASYANEELAIESSTNLNSEPIKHTTKMALNYKDVKLTIQCDSVTKADKKMIRSQMEFSAFDGQASLRIENQADDTENRAYSLLTGSMNPSGLEINADASLNIFSSIASHKATLALNGNGLTTSCTTTAQHSPMTFENVFHGGFDASGATMSITTKAGIKENKAELNVEGKLANTEFYLNGIFKGNLFDINTRNRVNLRLNEDGLLLSSNLVGSFNEMRTENANSLSLSMRSFTLDSKTDNFLDKHNSYIHEIKVNLEKLIATITVKNDLKVMDINIGNDAQFKAEPYNMEMTGTMMAVFSEEEFKHTYEIKFVDKILSTKCNTNGKLMGSHVTHTTDMEIEGLTLKFNNVAKIVSPVLRLDSSIKSIVEPFTLTIDAILNSEGGVYLYGRHNFDLDGKLLLKAEPMLFTQSFEYRASTSHDLENKFVITTLINNKINNILSLKEQSIMMKLESKVNEHIFNQELSAFNDANRMGIEMTGAISTPYFSEENQDYSISSFIKYDKNSDSHFIQIPFLEYLPAAIENMKVTMMRLMDQTTRILKDINTKYEISDKFQAKVAELKEVIDNFNYNLFVEDVRKFVKSMENFIANLEAKFPTDKVMNILKSAKDVVMDWIKKYNIAQNLDGFYTKMEAILSSYEIERMISAIMDEIVKIMKQYQIREKIQSAFKTLQSINIQPLLKKALMPAQELVNELYSFNFKQLIDDCTDYFIRMFQKIRSFDYDTFTAELKQKVADMSKIPCFGKLYGEFRVASPHYTLRSTADFENTTTTPITPEFKLNLISQASSTLKILDFALDASAHFAAPEKSQLAITENIKLDQSCFTLNHKGEIVFTSLMSAQGSAETTAKAVTELYVAEFVNNAVITVENEVSATMETNYKHDINMPSKNIFSDMSMNQKSALKLKDGTLRWTLNNIANEKIAVQDFSDEAAHKSAIEVVFDIYSIKVNIDGETSSSTIKMIQNVDADISMFDHVKVNAKFETETPFMKGSIAEVKFQAIAEDLKLDFTATHDAELIGRVEGTLSSSAVASVTPEELMFDTKNKGTAKVALPFRLSGKIDLQNDIALILNSEIQQGSWNSLARFNQYKYSHSFNIDNTEAEINLISQINGDANLDVLKERITIPAMTIPFIGITTPRLENFSLWGDTLLGETLTTTQQTLDMNSKFKYIKNPEVITIDINMEPVINSINANMKIAHKKMLISKDKAADLIATSYDKAKAEYEKYSVELPKTITIPAYKVPVINIEMSTFTIPLPDITLISMPTLHIPSALSKLTVPKITLPKILSIKIPKLGDLTHDFSMKTALITLKSDASILNKDSITIKLDASSSSEFEFLTGKIEVNSDIIKIDEFKMTNALSLKHPLIEGNHDSIIILSLDNIETTVRNVWRSHVTDNIMEINHDILVNPEKGFVVSMSSPSAGKIAVQMQIEHPSQVKAKLFGCYQVRKHFNTIFLLMKISVVDSEKLNIQTNWNMEIPNEIMLAMKEKVPVITESLSEPATMVYNEINKKAKFLGRKVRMTSKWAIDNFAEVTPSEMMTIVTDKTIVILKEYKKRVAVVLNAVITFLKETHFQIPGYEQRMSGLELYQTFSRFVADVSEEAVQKIPQYFSSIFGAVIDVFQTIEFTLPGSSYIVSGKEILNDLFAALKKVQNQIIVAVNNLGNIQLEDVFQKISDFIQFTIEQSEMVFQTIKSQNIEKLSTFVTDVYNDAINSKTIGDVAKQVEAVYTIIVEYLMTVRVKIQNIVGNMSDAQLVNDIKKWIDSIVKYNNTFQNNVMKTLEEKSQIVETYVRIGDREVEIELPLTFIAKFN
uniref:Apolipoprotein B-100-like n=1 Tax=Gouania willdenowi TaxID=441366 RepID=A0A8C5G644_GOUWI